jgi:hypothetical protein
MYRTAFFKRAGKWSFLGILIALLCVGMVGETAGAAKKVQVGTVQELAGRATITHQGETKSVVVRKDMPIYQNDEIKTMPGGKVRILLLDESVISVASGTKLIISEYVFSPEKKERRGLLKVMWGKVKCVVNDLSGYRTKKFNVNTETAVIGVRGTEFLVWAKAKSLTRVAGLKNEIEVFNVADQTRKVVVQAGKMTDVLMANAPTPPVEISPEMFKTLLDGLLPSDAVPPELPKAPSEAPSAPDAGSTASTAAKTAATAASTASGVASEVAGKAAVVAAGAAAAAGAAVAAVGAATGLTGDKDKESGESEQPKDEVKEEEPKPAASADTTPKTEEAAPERPAEKQAETAQAEQPSAPAKAPAPKPATVAKLVDLRSSYKSFRDKKHTQQSQRKVKKLYDKKVAGTPEATSPERFIDHGDGTVTDQLTGLMWQKDITDKNLSSFVLEYSDRNRRKHLGGFADWRPPTTEELYFLLLSAIDNPKMPITLPEHGQGLWTGDQVPNSDGVGAGYVFGFLYEPVLGGIEAELKVPTSTGRFSLNAVKAVRTIGKK